MCCAHHAGSAQQNLWPGRPEVPQTLTLLLVDIHELVDHQLPPQPTLLLNMNEAIEAADTDLRSSRQPHRSTTAEDQKHALSGGTKV